MSDPLNEDLMSLDTSIPLLQAPNMYDLKVEKAEVKMSGKNAAMLHLELSTVAPANPMEGTQILGPGVRVFDNIMLEPTGKMTVDQVRRKVAELLQSAVVPSLTSVASVRSTPTMLAGAVLRTKVGYEAAGSSAGGKSFPAKNVVTAYLKK